MIQTVASIDDFGQWEREQDRRPLTEMADPLALSWVAYHVWRKNPGLRWAAWADLEVHEHDREIARETRRYYRNKLALRALKGTGEQTQFARDLYDICNGGVMRECHRGMLYRLPYLYVEDVRRDELREKTLVQPDLDSLPRFLEDRSTRRLRRYGRIFRTRRSGERMEYWYHDEETGYPVMWAVDYGNTLRTVVDHFFDSYETPQIHARWCVGVDQVNDFRYWVIAQPELRFE